MVFLPVGDLAHEKTNNVNRIRVRLFDKDRLFTGDSSSEKIAIKLLSYDRIIITLRGCAQQALSNSNLGGNTTEWCVVDQRNGDEVIYSSDKEVQCDQITALLHTHLGHN